MARAKIDGRRHPELRRRRWKSGDARAALNALAESGLGLAAFAREVGIKPQRLQKWRRRLEAEQKITPPAFVELVRPQLSAPERSAPTLEVVLRSGDIVRTGSGVDEATLRVVISALRTC